MRGIQIILVTAGLEISFFPTSNYLLVIKFQLLELANSYQTYDSHLNICDRPLRY